MPRRRICVECPPSNVLLWVLHAAGPTHATKGTGFRTRLRAGASPDPFRKGVIARLGDAGCGDDVRPDYQLPPGVWVRPLEPGNQNHQRRLALLAYTGRKGPDLNVTHLALGSVCTAPTFPDLLLLERRVGKCFPDMSPLARNAQPGFGTATTESLDNASPSPANSSLSLPPPPSLVAVGAATSGSTAFVLTAADTTTPLCISTAAAMPARRWRIQPRAGFRVVCVPTVL